MIENYLDPGETADATQRRCYDCAHMRGAVSWWCTNKSAIAARGTRIPGIRNCEFWAPAPTRVPLTTRLRLLATRLLNAWRRHPKVT